MLTPSVRKAVLVGHIVTSIGWLGAVGAFLVLAIAGLISADAVTVHALYLAMALSGWYAIVPLCLASFASGVIISLGTPWGLFRHYWVLLKLGMTIPSTLLLLMHLRPIDQIVAATTNSASEVQMLKIQLVVETSAALAVLLTATVLSVYKPRGITRFADVPRTL